MAARNPTADAQLRAYFQGRVEPLSKRLLDIADAFLSEESVQERQEFERRVEKRLQNGAKFVPRKRQPR